VSAAADALRRLSLGDRLARAGLDLAYLAIGMATAILGFGIWLGAAIATLTLLVFVVGLPVFLLSTLLFRWTAELDRRNAALALGGPLRGRYRDHRGEGFFTRLGRTAGDPQTWKDLGWLVAHTAIGFVFGVLALGLVAQTAAMALTPAWYWAIPEGADVGVWHVDTLGMAFVATATAIPLAAVTALALRGMTIAVSSLAALLLGGGPEPTAEAVAAAGRGPALRSADPEALLAAQAAISALAFGITLAVWLLTGRGYFWPAWVALGLAIPLALHASVRVAVRVPAERRALAVQAAVSAVIAATAIAVWALAGAGTFWPIWALLGLLVALALHFLVATMWSRVFPDARQRELAERVDELTRTRRGALDVQNAELQRIERDLHDGAQARLVSLSMQLGRAEDRLAGQPETAALVRQARGEASAAIAELRDLARGIAPPVLADRGLAAAVEALGRRAAVPVAVAIELERRPPTVIESAAYFVVAEALTNVGKHAPGAEASVRVFAEGETLVVEVADNGPGGADPAGSGLAGLRGRVEALDGTLRVISPAGAGTTVRAELPCG
jgi:signal transduction histidine kinase